jgi:hypothetical protein
VKHRQTRANVIVWLVSKSQKCSHVSSDMLLASNFQQSLCQPVHMKVQCQHIWMGTDF